MQPVKALAFRHVSLEVLKHLNSIGLASEHVIERHDQQHQPDQLRPAVEAVDGGYPIKHDGNHRHRTQDVAQPQRHTKAQLDGLRHDGRLQGQKDEGEGRVDQRCERGAHIPKAGRAGQQIHVDAVLGRVVANGQTHRKDDDGGKHHGQNRIAVTVVQQQQSANGLV